MDGGVYKTQGADTCVYIPQVACAKKGRRTTIRKAPGGTALISRITRDEYELKVQKVVDKTLKKLAVAGHGSSQFFNLADSACTPDFKPEDMKANCTVRALQGHKDLINLVTPVQGDTLYRSIQAKSKPNGLIKTSLKGLMIAMARLNAHMVTHSDSHFNNLGWQGDQLVIFDWGRGTTDRKSFKHWVNKYLFIWTPSEKANWKTYSQHTLQFALLDEAANTKIMKKSGVYETIASVWDTLGLLGPARASGVVSEEKSAAFMKEVFAAIKTDPKQTLTDKLIGTLIPALFGDPPAIHPVVAERPMPPAEAAAVSRIIPVPAAAAPPAPAPAPAPAPPKAPVPVPAPAPAPVAPPAPAKAPVAAPAKAPVAAPAKAPVAAPAKDDKKLEDIKDACRKLLAPAGGRRVQKGGDFLAGGADTLVWDQKPTDAEKVFGGPAWLGLPLELKKGMSSPSIPEIFETDLATYPNAVVRMILVREDEMDAHRALKAWTDLPGNKFVKMHLNTFIGGNGVYETDTSLVLKQTYGAHPGSSDQRKATYESYVASAATDVIKAALVHNYAPTMQARKKINEAADNAELSPFRTWYGLVTRRQGPDVFLAKPIIDIHPSILALIENAQALLLVDGLWIHQDLHRGNMASMPDGTPVIHDYGRLKWRDYDVRPYASRATAPSIYNMNVLFNHIPSVLGDKTLLDYSQYYYVFQVLDTLSKMSKKGDPPAAVGSLWTLTKRLRDSSYPGDSWGPPVHADAGVFKRQNRRVLTEPLGDTGVEPAFRRMTYSAYSLLSANSLFPRYVNGTIVDGYMQEAPATRDMFNQGLRAAASIDTARTTAASAAYKAATPDLPDKTEIKDLMARMNTEKAKITANDKYVEATRKDAELAAKKLGEELTAKQKLYAKANPKPTTNPSPDEAANRIAYLETYFKDSTFETRYDQLARIWDLLSILRSISIVASDGKQPNEDVRARASHTARSLMQCVTAPKPLATRWVVRRIVNEGFGEIMKLLGGNYKPVTATEGEAIGEAYWSHATNDKGPRADPATRTAALAAGAAPAPAPPPPAAAPPPPAQSPPSPPVAPLAPPATPATPATPQPGGAMKGGAEIDDVKWSDAAGEAAAAAITIPDEKPVEETPHQPRLKESPVDTARTVNFSALIKKDSYEAAKDADADAGVPQPPEPTPDDLEQWNAAETEYAKWQANPSTYTPPGPKPKVYTAEDDAIEEANDAKPPHAIQGGKLTRRRRLPRLV